MNIIYEQLKIIMFFVVFLLIPPLSIVFLWRVEQRKRTRKEYSLHVIIFLASTVLGFALYTQSFLSPQHFEPWDINAGCAFYYCLSLSGGLVFGILAPQYLATCYIGSWLGQVIALFDSHNFDLGWLLLSVIVTGIYNYWVLLGGFLGKGIRIIVPAITDWLNRKK